MGKKVKILILMGMTISLLSCSIIEENSKKNIDIATNVKEMEVVESEEVIQEDIEEIKRISDEITALGDKYDVGFMDNSEDNRSEEELWGVVNVFVYGFIVMISLIGIVNVINTISLNILLKKKEFGTLGTIGMDKKQLYKMVILEGLLHGIIACIIGGIIAVGLSMVAVRIISYGFTFGYKLYWQPFAIGFLINIVVTIIASIIPLNKLKKMSLVETVRNIE